MKLFTTPRLPIALVAATVISAAVPSVQAANYYLQASQSAGQSWNDLSRWFSAPTGGTNPVVIAGNDFFTNGFALRTNLSGAASTFAGNSLTLNGGTLALIMDQPNYTRTVTNLIVESPVTEGGAASAISIYSGYTNLNLAVTNFTINATLNLRGDSGRGYTLNIANLTGSGDIRVSESAARRLSIEHAESFTGNIVLGETATSSATLEFQTDFASGGGLIVEEGSAAQIAPLNADLSFTSVILFGETLAAGTYSALFLATNYSTLFQAGGLGSITVIPEPSAFALMLGGLGLSLVALRRNQRRAKHGNT